MSSTIMWAKIPPIEADLEFEEDFDKAKMYELSIQGSEELE